MFKLNFIAEQIRQLPFEEAVRLGHLWNEFNEAQPEYVHTPSHLDRPYHTADRFMRFASFIIERNKLARYREAPAFLHSANKMPADPEPTED